MEARLRRSDTLLQVCNLRTVFPLGGGTVLAAVDDVSFTLQCSRTLCVVGESGSGKSMTARSIMRIVGPPGRIADGQILYQAQPDRPPIDIAKLHPRGSAMRAIRGRDIAMIFQEPMTSLSPIHRIGWQIGEPLLAHGLADRKTAHRRAIELLRQVEIPDPEAAIERYPFEFSGGMRQRAMIAMALACGPKILIADEPTTALDVTTQAEVLRLIKRLQIENGLAVLFITHDMGVVAQIADDVLVMYQGQVVERGPVETIFHSPEHPYTRRLLDSSKKLGMAAPPARPTVAATARTLLQVRDVALTYPGQATLFRKARPPTPAVRDVGFDLYEGENLGIVGESGSGKTTLGNCLIRVLTATAGQINYRRRDGAEVDLVTLDRPGLRLVHRDIRMVFQDPFASLNPRMTVEQVIGEPLLVNRIMSGTVLSRRVGELLAQVGLPRDAGQRYPHAFSGGQRQRIGIARTLALNPRLIIADEPTSALDVTLRGQILDLLLELQRSLGLSFVLISHDLGVIRYFCNRIAVMYRGQIVEIGPADDICFRPREAYTQTLLAAVPEADPRRRNLLSAA
ncbi:MAG TPA: ABC transporter ATP-binding protein [Acetobacteraceae bacterium]|jgi:peptide/nickel transport system ATP-binding protein|nr:ABC transporter ATP-binding protein [Acetobacteraceae bacterium]